MIENGEKDEWKKDETWELTAWIASMLELKIFFYIRTFKFFGHSKPHEQNCYVQM